LKEDLAGKVLKIRVLDPALDNGFIRQAMQMLKIHQSGYQTRWSGWSSSPGGKEPDPFLIEKLPIDQRGQLHKLMAHVDQINEPRTQQVILLNGAITVFHGKTKLQGFQWNITEPCSQRPMKSLFSHTLSIA